MSAVCDAVVKLIVDSTYRENRGGGSNVMGSNIDLEKLVHYLSLNLRISGWFSSFKSLTTILCGLPVPGCGGGDGV